MTPRILVLLSCLVALLLPACGGVPADRDAASPGEASAPYPLTVTDDAGRRVTIPAEPQRVVSLAPSNTELVCALGACERLVGVPELLDGYPAEVLETVAELPSVVSFGPVDREAVVGLEPDLVLAAGNELTSSDDIAALEQLGFPVVVLYPESLDDVYRNIELVGRALGHDGRAEELVDELEARAAAVVAAVAGSERPRTFYEVGVFEGTIYTAGEDSFLASLISLAGGEPITGDRLLTSIELEELVAADPELILLGDAAYDPTITPGSVGARAGWAGMTAIRDGRVVVVADDVVVTRPGPRIVEGLEVLARAIHPQRFD